MLIRARHFATDIENFVYTSGNKVKIDASFKKMLSKFTPDSRFGVNDLEDRYEFGFVTSTKPIYYLSLKVLPPIGDWILKSLSK